MLTLPLIRMEQEDGVVHRGGELQDIGDVVRDIRDLPEEDIRSFIQHDGTADDRQEEDRFEPGGRRKEEDDKDQDDDDAHDLLHLFLYVFLDELIRRRHADEVAAITDQIIDFLDGLVRSLRGIALFEGDIHDGVVILIVVIDIIVVDELGGAIDLRRQITPDDLIDTIDGLDFILILLRLIESDILQHQSSGTRIAENVAHLIDGDLRIHIIRKILRQIVIDRNEWIT